MEEQILIIKKQTQYIKDRLYDIEEYIDNIEIALKKIKTLNNERK